MQKHKSEAGIVKITLTLLLISSVVAALLATVNYFTAPVIAQNSEETKKTAIMEIFPETTFFESSAAPESVSSAQEIYTAYKNDEIVGYVVSVAPMGFGGEIRMMVGVTPKHTVKQVQIVSFSETAGVGTKVKEPDFLAQFAGGSGSLSYNGVYNAVSGATISSGAVLKGVNAALEAVSAM